MKFSRPIMIIMLMASVLFACNPQDTAPTDETGYPIDAITNDSSADMYDAELAYPSAEQQIEQGGFFVPEITIPLPQDGQAVVHGILLTEPDQLPYLAPSLYLGQMTVLDDGSGSSMVLSSISVEDDPIAIQSVDGEFVFSNIPPGEYGLFLWTPMSVFLVEDARTGNPVVFEVEAGEVYDLGQVFIQ